MLNLLLRSQFQLISQPKRNESRRAISSGFLTSSENQLITFFRIGMTSFITNNLYAQSINTYANTFEEGCSVEDKTQAIKEKIFGSFKLHSDVDQMKFGEMIDNVISLKPGLDLFARIIKANKEIIINDGISSKYNYASNSLSINFNERYFYVSLNSEGKRILTEAPNYIVLAHELIHAVHWFEGKETTNKSSGNSFLIDPTMDDEEEQLTITGLSLIDPDGAISAIVRSTNELACFHFGIADLCCENSFLAALGLPLRIDHNGPLSSPPTFIDLMRVGATATLEEECMKDPTIIDSIDENKDRNIKMSLLSAAAYYSREDQLNYLLSQGANVNQADEIGGPILAAIKSDHIELAICLVESGKFNPFLRDRDGNDALDYMHLHARWRFSSRHKPLKEKLTELSKSSF